jgi:hypothetical protein
VSDGADVNRISPLELTRQQRSHVLFVHSNANTSSQEEFLEWYRGAYAAAVAAFDGVLRTQQYEQDEVDITSGEFEPLPFRYLAVHELSVDGAEAAASVLDGITALHREHPAAEAPATWLYYPVSERVGRPPVFAPSMLTLAFANSVRGQEAAFREWYATRHIRHALNIPVLVSGQCFERTQFQRPGVMEARFGTIAVYEQEGTAESIVESFETLPESTFEFPMLDLTRFAESSYRPL